MASSEMMIDVSEEMGRVGASFEDGGVIGSARRCCKGVFGVGLDAGSCNRNISITKVIKHMEE